MRKTLLALSVVIGLGCSEKVEIARQLVQLDPNGGPPTVLTVAECPAYGSFEMDRTCVIGSDGKTYALTGALPSASAAPPYRVYFLFHAGYAPLAQNINTSGDGASIQVYAAPFDSSAPCLPEGRAENRIAATASLTSEGGVLVTVTDALPTGTEVVVLLGYDALFRGQAAPEASGFAERFFVGEGPTNLPPTVQATADQCPNMKNLFGGP